MARTKDKKSSTGRGSGARERASSVERSRRMNAYLSRASTTHPPDAFNDDIQGDATDAVTREETQPTTENRIVLMETSTDPPGE